MVRVRCKQHPSAQAHIVPMDPDPVTGTPRKWGIGVVPYGEVIELRLPIIEEREDDPAWKLKGIVVGWDLEPTKISDCWEIVAADADPEQLYQEAKARVSEAIAEFELAKAAAEQAVAGRTFDADAVATAAAQAERVAGQVGEAATAVKDAAVVAAEKRAADAEARAAELEAKQAESDAAISALVARLEKLEQKPAGGAGGGDAGGQPSQDGGGDDAAKASTGSSSPGGPKAGTKAAKAKSAPKGSATADETPSS